MKISKYKSFLLESQKPGMISQPSKKDLLSWMSYPGHQLSEDTVKELESNETIRPKEKITLYRGLLFTRKAMKLKCYKTNQAGKGINKKTTVIKLN